MSSHAARALGCCGADVITSVMESAYYGKSTSSTNGGGLVLDRQGRLVGIALTSLEDALRRKNSATPGLAGAGRPTGISFVMPIHQVLEASLFHRGQVLLMPLEGALASVYMPLAELFFLPIVTPKQHTPRPQTSPASTRRRVPRRRRRRSRQTGKP